MELIDAIKLVIEDSREAGGPDPDASDIEVIDYVRDNVDDAELASWVETEVIESEELAAAYQLVIDVNDDAIEDAFGND